jgi:asparagine synthase (glutamine-hydrolysing)
MHPPCLVSFSGGRDSSAVLAVATHVARREGLSLPVPATLRFPSAPAADETNWQEAVIDHLALPDWERRELKGQLDFVGPVAGPVLRRHGLLWPPNAHFHAPLLTIAAGGSLLTGFEGDGLFGGWRFSRVGDLLARRSTPRPRDALRLGFALAPPRARAELGLRREALRPMDWLTARERRGVERALAEHRYGHPVRWNAYIAWLARRRYIAVAVASLQQLAHDAGARLHHPLLDPRFLSELAHAGDYVGLGDRTHVMSAVFGELLPDEIVARRPKALFDEEMWGEKSDAFIAGWNGSGVDQALVNADALRKAWTRPVMNRDFHTATLLQAAWLAEA